MQNRLDYGGSNYYYWHVYTATPSSIASKNIGNTIHVASSYLITRNGDTFSVGLVNPTDIEVTQSSWNKYNTSTAIYQTCTVNITSSSYIPFGTDIAVSNGELTLSGTRTSVLISGLESIFRPAIEAKAGLYMKWGGNIYKLPSSITSSNLVRQESPSAWIFSDLTKYTLVNRGSETAYDYLAYPHYGWKDGYYYIRTSGGISSASILGKYFTIDNSTTMYYCGSDNTQSSTTKDWTFTNASVYSAVAQTTDAINAQNVYPADGFQMPNYYICYRTPGGLTDANIYGGVNYEQVINVDEDIDVGTTAGACISFQVDNIQTIQIGNTLTYHVKQENDSDWRQVGIFYVTSIKKGKSRYTITAYDGISKFDKVVDDWLNNLTFPITARDMLTSLCNECGVNTDGSTFVNSSMQLQDNFESINLTGRQVLSFIAQIGSGFAVCNASGVLQIKTLGYASATLTNAQYATLFQEDFTVRAIDSVRIAYDDDPSTQGVQAGTGTNQLGIYDNPLLFFDDTTQQTIQTAANNIYAQLNANSSYVPMQISTLQDFNISAGTRVTIGDSSTYIFRKTWSSSGVEFESTGNEYRKAGNVNKDSEINALRGKVHKLNIDVTGISSQVTDASIKANKSLTWTAEEGLVIQDETTGGHVLITGNDINVPTINAQLLNMLGCIKFDDFDTTDTKTAKWLETSGQIYRQNTVPSGTGIVVGAMWYCTANIGTTYTANTWYSYDGTNWTQTSNPYYVKSTYIDSTEIRTPTLTGNNIIVNGDNGGSFQVQRQGINIGFMGRGTAYKTTDDGSGERVPVEGVILANNDDGVGTYLETGDNYICITPAEVKLSYSFNNGGDIHYNCIYLNEDGAFYKDQNGEELQLGYARFG